MLIFFNRYGSTIAHKLSLNPCFETVEELESLMYRLFHYVYGMYQILNDVHHPLFNNWKLYLSSVHKASCSIANILSQISTVLASLENIRVTEIFYAQIIKLDKHLDVVRANEEFRKVLIPYSPLQFLCEFSERNNLRTSVRPESSVFRNSDFSVGITFASEFKFTHRFALNNYLPLSTSESEYGSDHLE